MIRSLLTRIADATVGRRLDRLESDIYSLRPRLDRNAMLMGRQLTNQFRSSGPLPSLRDAEFRVFSQAGEDGIIQYLISRVPIQRDIFIEFGVEDYRESNTRFLMMQDNWRGLVLDGSERNIKAIRNQSYYAHHDLTAMASFVTAETINPTITDAGIEGDIGLLSIDIDGNDYWVWKAIQVISPRIVICEYNSVLGNQDAVTIPYDPAFVRSTAHPSYLYFGASLKALVTLGEQKGYCFVGCNSAGSNAFFVRRDCMSDLVPQEVESGYVESRFREARDQEGRLSFVTGEARRSLIEHLPLIDVSR